MALVITLLSLFKNWHSKRITMKHFILIITILSFFTFCNEQKGKDRDLENSSENEMVETINESDPQSYKATYYLIRHAEKVRTDANNQDPSLATNGMLRAARWATYFEPIKLDAIYVTKYIRTQQTVSPLAHQKMISTKLYDPNTIYSEEFLKETSGKNVLIVGHSNTIPNLVNKLINEEKFTEMDDNDNATLFKVTLDGNNKKVETTTVE